MGVDARGITTHMRKGQESGPIYSFPVKPDIMCKWDSTFKDPSYTRQFGSIHSGVDINIKPHNEEPQSGADRDIGYPVANVVPGEVVHAGLMRVGGKRSSYGRVVSVAAHWADKNYIESLLDRRFEILHFHYCHLIQECVTVGDFLNAGDVVGGMGGSGTSESQYPVHLHFAIQIKPSPDARAVMWQRSLTDEQIDAYFLDPALIIGSRSGVVNVADFATATHPNRKVFKFS